MGKIVYSPVPGIPRSTIEETFLTHRRYNEWWYATGYLEAADGRVFAWQFTIAQVWVFGIKAWMLLTALTDVRSGEHRYEQHPRLTGRSVTATETELAFGDRAAMTFTPNPFGAKGHMTLHMTGEGYRLDVELDAVKPPVWHCDDGELVMGIPDNPKAKTYYWSHTNLRTTAQLTLNGETLDLAGKAWFDRQGGPFPITSRRCAWEWFSLRFFDDTEVMLFAFPQSDWQDGGRIDIDGTYQRLASYELTATDTVEADGRTFSSAWTVELDGATKYTISPATAGMFNYFFFEQLCTVLDDQGTQVGYAVAEVLPGVRNSNRSLQVFKRVKPAGISR